VLLTGAAEQFGTNIRATVATSIPNWIRGSLVLSTLLWEAFKDGLGLAGHRAALLTGLIVYGVALLSARRLRETYGASLDFVEA
jgi:putative MFS transporter